MAGITNPFNNNFNNNGVPPVSSNLEQGLWTIQDFFNLGYGAIAEIYGPDFSYMQRFLSFENILNEKAEIIAPYDRRPFLGFICPKTKRAWQIRTTEKNNSLSGIHYVAIDPTQNKEEILFPEELQPVLFETVLFRSGTTYNPVDLFKTAMEPRCGITNWVRKGTWEARTANLRAITTNVPHAEFDVYQDTQTPTYIYSYKYPPTKVGIDPNEHHLIGFMNLSNNIYLCGEEYDAYVRVPVSESHLRQSEGTNNNSTNLNPFSTGYLTGMYAN